MRNRRKMKEGLGFIVGGEGAWKESKRKTRIELCYIGKSLTSGHFTFNAC